MILNQKKTLLFLTCFFLITSLVGIDYYRRKIDTLDERANGIMIKFRLMQDNMFTLTQNQIGVMATNDSLIDDENHFVDVENLPNKPTLVFRIQESNCQECVIKESERLQKLAKTIGADRIIIWGKYSSVNSLALFVEALHVSFKAYLVEDIKWSYGSVDNLNIPYLFMLSGQKVKLLFFPDSGFPESTFNKYYSLIKDEMQVKK